MGRGLLGCTGFGSVCLKLSFFCGSLLITTNCSMSYTGYPVVKLMHNLN